MNDLYKDLPEYKRGKIKTTTPERRLQFAEMRVKAKLSAIESCIRLAKIKEEEKEKLREMVRNKFQKK